MYFSPQYLYICTCYMFEYCSYVCSAAELLPHVCTEQEMLCIPLYMCIVTINGILFYSVLMTGLFLNPSISKVIRRCEYK